MNQLKARYKDLSLPAISIIRTDIMNILRDYSLVMMLFVPLLITGLLRWLYPILLAEVPLILEYNMLVLAMLSMTSGAMPGMAMAFAILDEKDNYMLPALMVLPVSFKRIVLNRGVAIYVFGVVSSFITIMFSGISEGTLLQNGLLSLLAASPSVILALIPAFFAENKIEGATLAKAMNFILVFPIPAFIFAGWWTNLLMIFPAWWIYRAFTSVAELPVFLSAAMTGMLFHVVVIILIAKRVFNKILNNA